MDRGIETYKMKNVNVLVVVFPVKFGLLIKVKSRLYVDAWGGKYPHNHPVSCKHSKKKKRTCK